MKKLTRSFGIIAGSALIILTMAACNTLQSIEVQKEPTKAVYGQGQSLNTAGLIVRANYKKSSEEITNPGSLKISPNVLTKPGEETVTITFTAKTGLLTRTKTTTFIVKVIPVESISITQPPTVTKLKQGVTPTWQGLQVKVAYEKKAVPDETLGAGGLNFSGYDKDKGGNQTVTINYYGKTANFNVTVAVLEKIVVKSPPTQKLYYLDDSDPISTAGLVVEGTWNDGSSAQVQIGNQNLSGYDTSSQGQHQITVTYSGKTAEFPITVKPFDSLTAKTSKDRYWVKQDIDKNTISIQGVLDGQTFRVPVAKAKIHPIHLRDLGRNTIIVEAGGARDSFEVITFNPFIGKWKRNSRWGNHQNGDHETIIMGPDSWRYIDKHENKSGEFDTKKDVSGRYIINTRNGQYKAETEYQGHEGSLQIFANHLTFTLDGDPLGTNNKRYSLHR
jgi:hypothetical protein